MLQVHTNRCLIVPFTAEIDILMDMKQLVDKWEKGIYNNDNTMIVIYNGIHYGAVVKKIQEKKEVQNNMPYKQRKQKEKENKKEKEQKKKEIEDIIRNKTKMGKSKTKTERKNKKKGKTIEMPKKKKNKSEKSNEQTDRNDHHTKPNSKRVRKKKETIYTHMH